MVFKLTGHYSGSVISAVFSKYREDTGWMWIQHSLQFFLFHYFTTSILPQEGDFTWTERNRYTSTEHLKKLSFYFTLQSPAIWVTTNFGHHLQSKQKWHMKTGQKNVTWKSPVGQQVTSEPRASWKADCCIIRHCHLICELVWKTWKVLAWKCLISLPITHTTLTWFPRDSLFAV